MTSNPPPDGEAPADTTKGTARLSKSGRYVHMEDGTTWPTGWNPTVEGDADSLEWVLRYGKPTREELLEAASVVASYVVLVHDRSQKRRNEIVSKIRKECCND